MLVDHVTLLFVVFEGLNATDNDAVSPTLRVLDASFNDIEIQLTSTTSPSSLVIFDVNCALFRYAIFSPRIVYSKKQF